MDVVRYIESGIHLIFLGRPARANVFIIIGPHSNWLGSIVSCLRKNVLAIGANVAQLIVAEPQSLENRFCHVSFPSSSSLVRFPCRRDDPLRVDAAQDWVKDAVR
jgi:hypothetical protein